MQAKLFREAIYPGVVVGIIFIALNHSGILYNLISYLPNPLLASFLVRILYGFVVAFANLKMSGGDDAYDVRIAKNQISYNIAIICSIWWFGLLYGFDIVGILKDLLYSNLIFIPINFAVSYLVKSRNLYTADDDILDE